MTEYIKRLRDDVRAGRHHIFRRNIDFRVVEGRTDWNYTRRVCECFCAVMRAEEPVVNENSRILFMRTVKNLPAVLTDEEWKAIRGEHFVHESGRVCNICPDYGETIRNGLLLKKRLAEEKLKEEITPEQAEFYRCAIHSIDAVLDLTQRYREEALRKGNLAAAAVLERVPAYGARTFREALQSLRILQFSLWCEGNYHNVLGRFDQYMFPYLKADLDAGRLTREEAFELLQEFFISLNVDSDLYPGIQQGDNGQSLMLGGVDRNGISCFNLLSEMCLDACRELKLIDPKINLRVSGDTPFPVYERGTLLTKEGLGFPQYSNDDVVIEGLVRKGYDLEDARDYVTAACWEFIIPGVGTDIPNIAAINIPALVNDAVSEDLFEAADYKEFFCAFSRRLKNECHRVNESTRNIFMLPAPFMSVLMKGCLERGSDVSHGCKYTNYGYHGVGISTAVDSLYAIKRMVFETGELSKEEAIAIVKGKSKNEDGLMTKLRYELPKFGDDNEDVDEIAVALINSFDEAVAPLHNDKGGCIRAGTGSAMFYLWYAENVGDCLSGHKKGEAFSANYSPELFVRSKGPYSVIRSFTRPDLKKVVNGGPLTMEFHSSVFRDMDSVNKVASLVRTFILLGGHQLQLNSVNLQNLLDAQKNPDQYRNLIVRVWGWSAYFVELDKEFQDHVISRQEFNNC